jgi:uncharacterized membrane protein YgcG
MLVMALILFWNNTGGLLLQTAIFNFGCRAIQRSLQLQPIPRIAPNNLKMRAVYTAAKASAMNAGGGSKGGGKDGGKGGGGNAGGKVSDRWTC